MTWNYKYFTEDELRCKCGCGRAEMKPDFMEWLDAVRIHYGKPMIITSGYRCPDHEKAIGGGNRHPLGVAVDVKVSGGAALALLSAATALGVRCVGIKQTGDHDKRFLHLDMVPPGVKPLSPWMWGY